MGQKEFSTVHIYKQSIDNLYGLVDKTVEIAEPVRSGMTPLGQRAFTEMKENKIELEKRIKKNMASTLTPELNELNKVRLDHFSEIKRYVTNALKSSIPKTKSAGTNLYELMKPYWDTQNKPLNTITSLFEEMLERLKVDTSLVADVKTIGIETQMGVLEATNANYDDVYKRRNTELGAKTGNPASEIREQVIKSYEQFCSLIEQSVNLLPTPIFEKLFQEMDMLRKKYAALKSSSSKEDEEVLES